VPVCGYLASRCLGPALLAVSAHDDQSGAGVQRLGLAPQPPPPPLFPRCLAIANREAMYRWPVQRQDVRCTLCADELALPHQARTSTRLTTIDLTLTWPADTSNALFPISVSSAYARNASPPGSAPSDTSYPRPRSGLRRRAAETRKIDPGPIPRPERNNPTGSGCTVREL
jgi:hypothetical protein